MPVIEPAVRGDTGFFPTASHIWAAPHGSTDLIATGIPKPKGRLEHQVLFRETIQNFGLIASGIRGIQCVAYQVANADFAMVAQHPNTSEIITTRHLSAQANRSAWLHLWVQPGRARDSTGEGFELETAPGSVPTKTGLWTHGGTATGGDLVSTGRAATRGRFKHRVWYVPDAINDGDTMETGMRGLLAVAFQNRTTISKPVNAHIASQEDAVEGIVTFRIDGGGGAARGWLHVWQEGR